MERRGGKGGGEKEEEGDGSNRVRRGEEERPSSSSSSSFSWHSPSSLFSPHHSSSSPSSYYLASSFYYDCSSSFSDSASSFSSSSYWSGGDPEKRGSQLHSPRRLATANDRNSGRSRRCRCQGAMGMRSSPRVRHQCNGSNVVTVESGATGSGRRGRPSTTDPNQCPHELRQHRYLTNTSILPFTTTTTPPPSSSSPA